MRKNLWPRRLLVLHDEHPAATVLTHGSTGPGDAAAPFGDAALFRAAIEAVGDAVIITGPELDEPGPRIRYTNQAFSEMSGYSAAEVLGRTPRLLQGPATERDELDRLRATLEAGESFRGDGTNYRKDGSTYVIDWLVTPIRDESGTITAWMSVQRDITQRRRAERRQAQLLAELQHRTRNLLAVVVAVCHRTLSGRRPLETFQARFTGRLGTLARVQGILSRADGACNTLEDLIRSEIDALSLGSDQARVSLDGPAVTLPDATLQTLALALHELATNAAEHGALSDGTGTLTIRWHIETEAGRDACLILQWVETHDPLDAASWDPGRRGYGRDLIERALPHTLRTRLRYELSPSGLFCRIELPLTGHESRDCDG